MQANVEKISRYHSRGHPDRDYTTLLKYMNWLISRKSFADLAPLLTGLKHPVKELSEALTIFQRILRNAPRTPWTLVDLCSGKRALLSAITVLNIRSANAVAVDVGEPVPMLRRYGRLVYIRANMFAEDVVEYIRGSVVGDVYVAGIHCCKTLSFRALEIARELGARRVWLVPCCADFGAAEKLRLWRRGRPTTYEEWAKTLARYGRRLGFSATITRAPEMMTDKNIVIELWAD